MIDKILQLSGIEFCFVISGIAFIFVVILAIPVSINDYLFTQKLNKEYKKNPCGQRITA